MRNFIYVMVNKIIDKFPVKYNIVCNSCLSTLNMAKDKGNSVSKMMSIISCVLEFEWLPENDCEQL